MHGKNYSIIEICDKSTRGEAAGTYEKVSNISKEMNISYSPKFKINELTNIDSFSSNGGQFELINNTIVAKNVPFTATNSYNIPGSFKLRYKDAVSYYESVINPEEYKNYDLLVEISNIKLYDIAGPRTANSGDLKIFQSIYGAELVYEWVNNTPNLSTYSPIQYDVSIKIVDGNNGDAMPTDGEYIFSAYDLDVSSRKDKDTGIVPNYISDSNRGYGYYSEGINLIDGFDLSTIKVANGSFLHQLSSNEIPNTVKSDYGLTNFVRLFGEKQDGSSEFTEFTVKADATKELKFQWTMGAPGGTALFSYYQPQLIEFDKVDDSGNKITGAQLELYYGDETTPVKSWTTDNENELLFLNPGEYTLKEISAPNGYNKSNDIVFYIDINNQVTREDGLSVTDGKIIITDPKKDTSVLVHHYITGTTTKLSNDVTITGKYNDEYTTSVATDIPTQYEVVDSTPENYTGNMAADQIVVTYYYKLKKYPYIVKYVDEDSLEEIRNQKRGTPLEYGSSVTAESERVNIPGYEYVSADRDEITIGTNTNNNVITLYYKKQKNLSYIVNYLEKGTNEPLKLPKITNGVAAGTVISATNEVIDINGYYYDSAENDSITIVDGDNILNLYYTKRNNLDYIVRFLEKDTYERLRTPKTVEGVEYDSIIYTENEIEPIEGYYFHSADKDRMRIKETDNILNLYYVKRTDLEYTIYYKETGSEIQLKEPKHVVGQTYGAERNNRYTRLYI